MKKILIVNPFGIGDVIFSMPLVDILKECFSESYIGYICNKRAYEVIRTKPGIDKIFIFEKDDFRTSWCSSILGCVKKIFLFLMEIRRERFDIVVDLSLGYQYSLYLKLIGIRSRLGFNYRNRGRFLTQKIEMDGFHDRHVVKYYLDILKLLGIDHAAYKVVPRIMVDQADSIWADAFLKASGVGSSELLIGVVPGCGASWGADAGYRRWGTRGFAAVCDGVVERYGARVILFGNSKEEEICTDIRKEMKRAAITACGRTSLGNLLGLMRRCRLIITNDGGPLHMAAGIGIRTVSIFGPVDEKVYGPYPPGKDHIVISRNLPCRPCYKKFKYNPCEERKCLADISPDEVLGAVDAFLSAGPKAGQ